MAQKYYTVKEAAEILGVSEEEVKQMQQRRELYGYRDGADWKFKVEEVDRLADQRSEDALALPDQDEGDVLLSEIELGESDPGSSGTVIGMESGGNAVADSDLQLADSGVRLDDEPKPSSDEVDSKVSQFEELDLALEEDLSLHPEDEQAQAGQAVGDGGSNIDLAAGADDDDLVLGGGSGAGSDVTIGGDSGISLVDPADSGLSLEEPLDLAGADESLELGEDDMIALTEEGDTDAPTELKTDDDFLLTPLEEVGDEEDSESGSQVIALDTEGQGDEGATMIAGGPGGPSMAAMLDEDLTGGPAEGLEVAGGMDAAAGGAIPLGGQPAGLTDGAPITQPSAALLPEAPYSIWNVLSLALCSIFLILGGMMMYDLLRHMWSWGSPYGVNSSIMDWILSFIE
jgi:excisionase family DNA binding protein